VPLDALLLDEEGQLVGERWRIETRTSFWELLGEDPPVDPAGALVALGDVAYGAEPVSWSEEDGEREFAPALHRLAHAGGHASVLRGSPFEEGFKPLDHTGPEVHAIAALFRGAVGTDAPAVVLEGTRASRASLEVLAPRVRWLHLATHGWFAPESIRSFADRSEGSESGPSAMTPRTSPEETVRGMSPMLLSGLALAGASPKRSSFGRAPGLLTAEELSGLDLTNCELAVLSACDTNVGLVRAGQGVASLQKALHMAGARSVITSLWKVDDAATREFFERFYTALWQQNLPKSEALWRTKMQLRVEGHPVRDWAAWVLTGDPD
jgi:CHAT domain-containing protein